MNSPASSSRPDRVDLVVLGATGYVGGEALRLGAEHPRLHLAAAVSGSSAGAPIAGTFPHLDRALAGRDFAAPGEWITSLEGDAPVAVVSALPHGASAKTLAETIAALEARGREVFVCDLAADFRLDSPAAFAEVYGQPHGAPEIAGRFLCAPPDLVAGPAPDLAAHPGCFTTAVTLGAAPIVASGLVESRLVASCVTGSTGSGRTPGPKTHHPERHGEMRAYSPLAHRHRFEMEAILGREGAGPCEVAFLPHSGPFARGIHATLAFRLRPEASVADAEAALRARWEGSPFVTVTDEPPRLKDVTGTNRAAVAVAGRGRDLVVFSVIDNLLKGAAGGAIQWINRRFGFDEALGLDRPAPPWM
ncbi:MAG: N-acetyl-gamma-glutamyl-phosphate reductase [Planctomycetota bacterium]